jgi:hypothetical protein
MQAETNIQELAAATVDSTISPMGPHVDVLATSSFGFIVVIFTLLRLKVRGAIEAKEVRLRQELLLKKIRVQALDTAAIG